MSDETNNIHFVVSDSCILCGACVENCVSNALKIEDQKVVINEKQCIGCGQCFALCPQGAVQMFGCDSSVDYTSHHKIE